MGAQLQPGQGWNRLKIIESAVSRLEDVIESDPEVAAYRRGLAAHQQKEAQKRRQEFTRTSPSSLSRGGNYITSRGSVTSQPLTVREVPKEALQYNSLNSRPLDITTTPGQVIPLNNTSDKSEPKNRLRRLHLFNIQSRRVDNKRAGHGANT